MKPGKPSKMLETTMNENTVSKGLLLQIDFVSLACMNRSGHPKDFKCLCCSFDLILLVLVYEVFLT